MERVVLERKAMVRLVVAFSAPSARAAQDLLDALRYLEPLTRLQAGCLRCSSWMESDLTMHHMEEWETETDVRRWVRSSEFRSLLGMIESARDPRVQFDFVTTTRGLDYVAEVRGELT
jgi:hypothetical protein